MNGATTRRSLPLFWGGSLVAVLLLVAWTRALWSGYLLLGGVVYAGLLLWLRLRSAGQLQPNPRRWAYAAMGFLALGFLAAGIAHWRFELIEFRWEQLSAGREETLARRLERRMDELRTRTERAAELGAAAVNNQWRYSFAALERVRQSTGVDALVFLGQNGDPIAWAGEHRGLLPDTVRTGPSRAYFEERPLFSYLYYVQPVPDGRGRVISAVLIETGLGAAGSPVLDDVFESPLDARVTFYTGRRPATGRTVWTLAQGSDTTARAVLRPITQQERRAEVERAPRRIGVLLAALAFALFTLAYLTAHPRGRGATQAPLLALLPLLAVAPLGEVLGVQQVFSPGFFLLRSGDLTLGRVLVLLVPVAALIASLRRPVTSHRSFAVVLAAGAAAVALAYPGGLQVMIAAAARPLLESATPLWIGLQLACVLLLAVVTALAMPRVQLDPDAPMDARLQRALVAGGVVVALVLGMIVATRGGTQMTTRWAVLWVIPFGLAAAGAAFDGGRRGAIRRWLLSGWLAMSVVLPHLWTAHIQARLASAETELATLGSQSDPYLDYLLRSFGEQAVARHADGESGVQLLYRTWVASGLAREGYEARITLWSDDNLPLVDLGTGEELTEIEARVLLALLDEARVEGVPAPYPFYDQPNLSRVLTVPLDDGQVITVLVPPRRTLGRGTGLSFFFGGERSSTVRLNLVPSQTVASPRGEVPWERVANGWRRKTDVQYPDQLYHAHLLVPAPGRGVWLARAALLVTLDAAVLLAIWMLGVIARGASPMPRGSWAAWVGSFRARVTFALFGFFLVPTVTFGYIAFRALAQEVERATQIVAGRAAEQAVNDFMRVGADLRVLAQRAGADVLLYSRGELQGASSAAALELGLYNAWMPPMAFGQLEGGQERTAQDILAFGDQPYVIAFHSMVPSGVLAVPMPLVSGDIAVRQRELAHVIAFAAVLGALLSLALSVAVGRALAGPIGLLRRASAAVGAGRLRVQLPEDQRGEFGQVFTSFNRMVRRLRRARGRELRSARVLAWGEMARQVAHEIKNPLTPIKLSVQHLRRAHRDRHPSFDQVLEGSVHEILREIDRLSEIARAFSRYGAPAFAAGPLEAVDAAGVIQEALTLYRAGDEAVRYHHVLDPGLPPVLARAGELKEVLLNLIENARAALDGTGDIVVRALAHDEHIELEVEDNGSGMAPELLPRVFEPHFSTRTTGTGLGLAIVRRLVEGWGGTVSVDSRAGAGTTVRLRLLPVPAPSAADVTESGS